MCVVYSFSIRYLYCRRSPASQWVICMNNFVSLELSSLQHCVLSCSNSPYRVLHSLAVFPSDLRSLSPTHPSVHLCRQQSGAGAAPSLHSRAPREAQDQYICDQHQHQQVSARIRPDMSLTCEANSLALATGHYPAGDTAPSLSSMLSYRPIHYPLKQALIQAFHI